MDEQVKELQRVGKAIHEATINTLQSRDQKISLAHYNELVDFSIEIAHDIVMKPEVKRVAVELQTGMGKTTMLALVPAAAKSCGYDYPMLISVPNRVAMFELHKSLSKTGWDMDDVAYVYSREELPEQAKELPEPTSVEDWPSKSIVLCCHARINFNRDDWLFLIESDLGQRVVFYDEALNYGSAYSFTINFLKKDLDLVKDYLPYPVVGWYQRLHGGLEALSRIDPESSKVLSMDAIFDDTDSVRPCDMTEDVKKANQRFNTDGRRDGEHVPVLMELADERYSHFRVIGKTVLCFSYNMPPLERLFVMDASHKHSRLSLQDQSIRPLGLGNAKRYDNVKVIAYPLKRGKNGIRDDLESHLNWIHEMHKQYGTDALYIVFKGQKDAVIKRLGTEENILHWGMHMGLNAFSGKEHLVCLGLLRMANDDAAAYLALTQNDHWADTTENGKIADEESVLDLYQAVSRGRCRNAEIDSNGITQALPMTIHISGELNNNQQKFLQQVMPGIKYFSDSSLELVERIYEALRSKEGAGTVSTQVLKEMTGLSKMRTESWNKLTAHLPAGWTKPENSRSYVFESEK